MTRTLPYSLPQNFDQGRLRDDERLLITVLTGLVPLHVMRLRDPVRMAEARATASERLELISGGDILAGSRAVHTKADRDERRQLLNAIALTVAVFAHEPGGVSVFGEHWCTAPHPGCPNGARAEGAPAEGASQ